MLKNFLSQMPLSVVAQLKNLDLHIKSDDCRAQIDKLLQRSVLVGGKRLRPLLTYLMADFLDIPPKDVKLLAETIELVHAASLSHDDVIDGATTRRGIPSINIQSSNKMAVLAGDYLLADVIIQLSRLNRPDLLHEMAKVIKDLTEGEWIQSDASKNRCYTREIIAEVACLKTSSVMSWCFVAPCLAKGLPENFINYARELGTHLGLAFQLIDDTLDFSENSNKDNLLDLDNGIVNAVLFELLELNPELKNRYLKGEKIADVWEPSHLEEAISMVRRNAEDHLVRCHQILDILCREIPDGRSENERIKKVKPLRVVVDFLGQRQA